MIEPVIGGTVHFDGTAMVYRVIDREVYVHGRRNQVSQTKIQHIHPAS